jgi:dienelactone hydrolase
MSTSIRRPSYLFLILFLCLPSLSLADVLEEVMEVPVSVKTIYGQEVKQPIKVTIFHEDKRKKAPYLVLNHGRPANVADFAKMKRQRYANISRYFVSLGFVVLVPTRVGYGESGGPDVEYAGRCESKYFAPVWAAAADQTVTVLKTAAKLPYVDLSRGLVVGQSFGGMISITLSTMEIPGLVGAINFAGGGGGNPKDRPANPCSSGTLTRLLKDYGAISKVPTLWLYSENDRFWGSTLPKEWFNAFVQAGGKAEFVQLPPYKEDGHTIFTGNRKAWKSAFEDFLGKLGFPLVPKAQPGRRPDDAQ